VDVVEATCRKAGTDVVELVSVVVVVAVVAPKPASVPRVWKKKRFGATSVASLDGTEGRFHIGAPEGSVADG